MAEGASRRVSPSSRVGRRRAPPVTSPSKICHIRHEDVASSRVASLAKPHFFDHGPVSLKFENFWTTVIRGEIRIFYEVKFNRLGHEAEEMTMQLNSAQKAF